MAGDPLRIATRGSQLALAQARWVAGRIRSLDPDINIEFVEITTAGDIDRTSPVTTLTEVGAFVRAVQHAVIDGQADIAVHSSKDLPVMGPVGLHTVYPIRESPWDVMCGSTPDALPPGARVGTGSPRRAAQLALLRADVAVEDIRGNVDTRLRKQADHDIDAIVVAEAGLRRIGREAAIDHRFTIDEMVPAPGQGALAVEAAARSETAAITAQIEDPATRVAIEAERAVLARTGAGCRAALGAYARVEPDGTIAMHGFVQDERGPRRGRATGSDTVDAARRLIEELGL